MGGSIYDTRLDQIMCSRGMPNERIAYLLGVGCTTVANWRKKGIEHASAGNAIRCARALCTTVEDIAGRPR